MRIVKTFSSLLITNVYLQKKKKYIFCSSNLLQFVTYVYVYHILTYGKVNDMRRQSIYDGFPFRSSCC